MNHEDDDSPTVDSSNIVDYVRETLAGSDANDLYDDKDIYFNSARTDENHFSSMLKEPLLSKSNHNYEKIHSHSPGN